MKNRKKMSNRRSGGIVLAFKENLNSFIEIIDTESKYILWFKYSGKLLNANEPVIFGIVYIPPESSKYSSDEAFAEIEQEYLSLSTKTKHICLMGDFNARTASDNDFVVLDDNVHSEINVNEYIYNNVDILENLDIPLIRKSKDCTKNRYGNLLLNFCKGNSLFIVNSRVGQDQGLGKFTCKNSSVVDYCIVSPELFKVLKEFEILEYCNLYSDVHSPIHFILNLENITQVQTSLDATPKKYKIKPWEPEKKESYQSNMNEQKLIEIENKLIDYKNNPENIDIETINSVVDELGGIFLESGIITFGKKVIRKNNPNRSNNDKPWFDQECKFARQNYRKLKKRFKNKNSLQNKINMARAEKNYKNTLDTKYKRFCNKLTDEISKYSKQDPKKFWRLLGKHKRSKQPNIEIESLYNFFKTLNEADPNDEANHINEPLNDIPDYSNEKLNSQITKEEILKCINNLKNDKACADDEIINEYIKSTAHQLINVYVNLFNIIFDTGVIPESWLVGIIKPIYKNKGNTKDPKNYRPITILSCLGKLFTSILNNRLTEFSDEFEIIKENQCGFRQKYCTIDSIFTLFSFFQILKYKKKTVMG